MRALKYNKKAFTLLELIIVIIIIGILAVLGLSQYTKIIEKGRISEAAANMANIRKSALSYYLQNGTLATITNADVGIGTGLIPTSCNSSYYFKYSLFYQDTTRVSIWSYRCDASGKPPQLTGEIYAPRMIVYANGSAGCNCWMTVSGYNTAWCAPCSNIDGQP